MNMDAVDLRIDTSQYSYTPVVSGAVKLTSERAGTPGKLVFSVVKDGVINFHEGDQVRLCLGDLNVFRGYVFKKQRTSNGLIQVTAYDQLRYLKNRDTYTYADWTATRLVSQIAADYGLICGTLEETGYLIPARVESSRSIFDIVQTAIDLTYEASGELFVLYDDFGSLRLGNVGNMVSTLLISAASAGEFDYTSSIDDATYNSIKLASEDESSGETVYYCASNTDLIGQWGLLQYYGRLESGEDGVESAGRMLSLYGKKTRRLQIKDAVGDIQVRAGCLIPIQLDLGDLDFNAYLMVETVTHTFRDGSHTMDLSLVGGEFVA